jgi:hypothetical protein
MFSTSLLVLSLAPLVAANVWHGILLSLSQELNLKSISEKAASQNTYLTIHRFVHIGCSILLLTFALIFLLPEGQFLLFWLLVAGAFFDVIEVCVLNKRTAAITVNRHTLTAWAMAICYLLYTFIAIWQVKLGLIAMAIITILLLIAIVTSIKRRFAKFYVVQHCFFCVVAVFMAWANWVLLSQ